MNKSDAEAWERYEHQTFADDYKQKICDIKIGQNEYSILHLAAKNCRPTFCRFLLEDIKIDVDMKCRDNLTPLHLLVKSNVFFEQDCLNSENEVLAAKISAVNNNYILK